MKELQHPNVMGLIGICLDAGPSPLIVIPYEEGIELKNLLSTLCIMSKGGRLLKYLVKIKDILITCVSTDDDEVGKIYLHR